MKGSTMVTVAILGGMGILALVIWNMSKQGSYTQTPSTTPQQSGPWYKDIIGQTVGGVFSLGGKAMDVWGGGSDDSEQIDNEDEYKLDTSVKFS